MPEFKLIAIIPFNCDKKLRKNLTLGKPYQFYSNYKIEVEEGARYVKRVVKKETSVPKDLYALKNGIHLSISAVVGKNGSGKSSLFDLLFYATYILSTQKQKNNEPLIEEYSKDLFNKSAELDKDHKRLARWVEIQQISQNGTSDELPKSLSAELIQLVLNHKLKIDFDKIKSGVDTSKKILTELGYQKDLHYKLYKDEKEEETKRKNKFVFSLIYEIGANIYGLEFAANSFSKVQFSPNRTELTKSIQDFNLEEYFYTVALNYSHHSLNSNTIGSWISKLFHKNDAYITPLVINPMRIEGNFDINHESKLSNERLMSNVIYNLIKNADYEILDKYKVTKFIFSSKKFKRLPLEFGKISSTSPLGILVNEKAGINVLNEDIIYWETAFAYLDDKIKRVNENYSFLIYSGGKEDENKLINFLRNDKSHITKKIRQTLNFLKGTYKNQANRKLWQHPDGQLKSTLTAENLLAWIASFEPNLKDLRPMDLAEYALPGFFNIDFEFESDPKGQLSFKELSSGERQLIFNTNSILYHLYNLQSIHQTSGKNDRDRVKYKNVNIVLDEIELYHHPEMQRQLVRSLVEAFELVKGKGEEGISSINLCFLTHSPFILSDIPKENVLKLNQAPADSLGSDSETFGANVYDLLHDSFFMKDGFIGDYAMKVINDVLTYIDNSPFNESTHTKMVVLAELIGDELIRSKLLEMLQEKINNGMHD